MQIILKQFYLKVIQSHSLKTNKSKKLISFFQLFNSLQTKGKFSNSEEHEQNKSNSTFSQQGDEEQNHYEKNGFISNCQDHKILNITFNPISCISKDTKFNYASVSQYKLIIYAVFVNQSSAKNIGQTIDSSKKLKRQTKISLKKIKAAMISAANLLKQQDRKKYVKVRFLYQKLLSYLHHQQFLNNQQQYIKIIIEEFQQSYIQSVIFELQKKSDELMYSKTFYQLQTNTHESFYESKATENSKWKDLQPVLNLLDICLFVNDREYGSPRNNLHINIQQNDNQEGYKLIRMTNQDTLPSYQNYFTIQQD